MIFDYPPIKKTRRHGPSGYRQYEQFRPWLRDEFCFRCIYCLKRETWGQVTGEFELDHFEPQVLKPIKSLDYENLVYACCRCNAIKGSQRIADPFDWLWHDAVTILPDGYLQAHHQESRRLILQMDLNSPELVRWRVLWMRVVELASEHDHALFLQLVDFPSNLPNLSKLRPHRNHRPSGISASWFALKQQGLLPSIY